MNNCKCLGRRIASIVNFEFETFLKKKKKFMKNKILVSVFAHKQITLNYDLQYILYLFFLYTGNNFSF